MIIPDRHIRQLLVESGLAALNNNLQVQAESVLQAIPLLTNDHHARTILEAVFYVGLNDISSAHEKLKTDNTPEGDLLRKLLHPPY